MLCRHLSRRHGAKYAEYLRFTQPSQPEPTQSSIVNFTAGAGSQSSDSIAARSSSTSTYSRTSTRAKHLMQSLWDNVIIGCGLPVSLVDHPKTCKFLSDMDARYDPPCRQTVTQTLVPKSVQTQKDALRAELDKCNSISLTTDVWTDRRMHAYLGITVHALVGGNPKSNLLAFRTLTGSHTGQRIADEIDAVVREFDVKDKIRCVVTDNASNMLKAMYLFFPGVVMLNSIFFQNRNSNTKNRLKLETCFLLYPSSMVKRVRISTFDFHSRFGDRLDRHTSKDRRI